MGMHIGSSYASMGAQPMSSTSLWQQRQQNMGALKSALQSGDLSSAQSAFSAMSANMPNMDPNSALGQIGQALQTGDISTASKISSSWKSHAGVEGAKEQSYGNHAPNAAIAANDPSSYFATALINSLTQTGLISATQALTPASSTAASTVAAPAGATSNGGCKLICVN